VQSRAPVMRISGAPQFIVPPEPKQEDNKKQWDMDKLRETDGMIPLQYGTNQYASQKRMTGFGTPRDVAGKHLHRFWDVPEGEVEFMGEPEQPQQQQYQSQQKGGPPQYQQQQQQQHQQYQ